MHVYYVYFNIFFTLMQLSPYLYATCKPMIDSRSRSFFFNLTIICFARNKPATVTLKSFYYNHYCINLVGDDFMPPAV
jgi:hypothetical protein